MFLKEDVKKFQKKVGKAKKELLKVLANCNQVIYTEQNEEDLNDVKAYVSSKIKLLTEMEAYLKDYFQNKLECSFVGFVANVMNYKQSYCELSQDARLNHLQEVYAKKTNCELVSI